MQKRLCASFAAAVILAFAAPVLADQSTSVDVVPSPLLAVEQNRHAIVDGVLARWRDSLTKAYGSQAPQREAELRSVLLGLRSDQLLSISLAGTTEGVAVALREPASAIRDGVVEARPVRSNEKALGDTNSDVVFTPLTPCRILDTRVAGGALSAGVSRTFVGY